MKPEQKHNYVFEFSPKLIRFLGEELIHDKKIAIAELVKNSYDADASKCVLSIEDDKIIIEDDGIGMNTQIIKDYWLRPGNSPKSSGQNRTPKYQRMPIGEKGVGRLGAHKLGEEITVISKQANHKEVSFHINWKDLEEAEYINDLNPIQVIEHTSETVFKDGATGTRLTIERLKDSLKDKDIKQLRSDLLKMLPPFASRIQDQFQIDLTTNGNPSQTEDQLSVDDVCAKALFRYFIVFEKGKVTSFEYEFRSPNVQKIPSKKIELDDIKDKLESLRAKYCEHIAADNQEVKPSDVGPVTFQGYIFDSKFSRSLGSPHIKIINDYLRNNGGIRVYRDGMRVYNYGEGGKDNDILNLDRKRAKRLGDNIGYNQILAIIELDREKSRALIEKTNREGFIHNQTFLSLQQDLDFCMEVVLHYRKIDRANMEPLLGKEYDKADIETKIKKIVKEVNKLNLSDEEKDKFKARIYEFSEEFSQLKNVFLTAANTGLNLSFIIHEVDKIIDHLEKKILEKDFNKINAAFIHLKETIAAYKTTIQLKKKSSNISVKGLINQSISNTEFRFDSHGIELRTDLKGDELSISGKKGLIIGVLMNLFDNAIYWLSFYKIEKKKIYIRAYGDEKSTVILVADNGKGFNISFEAALGAFISGRFDDSSMGIGLHLAEQVMLAHKGSIEQGDWQEENLPEEFSQGAIIKLRFPRDAT